MIIERLKTWALMLAAVALVLVGAYIKGGRAAKAAGDKSHELDEAKRAAAGAQGVRDAELEVDKKPVGGAAAELRDDWMRDDGGDGK